MTVCFTPLGDIFIIPVFSIIILVLLYFYFIKKYAKTIKDKLIFIIPSIIVYFILIFLGFDIAIKYGTGFCPTIVGPALLYLVPLYSPLALFAAFPRFRSKNKWKMTWLYVMLFYLIVILILIILAVIGSRLDGVVN